MKNFQLLLPKYIDTTREKPLPFYYSILCMFSLPFFWSFNLEMNGHWNTASNFNHSIGRKRKQKKNDYFSMPLSLLCRTHKVLFPHFWHISSFFSFFLFLLTFEIITASLSCSHFRFYSPFSHHFFALPLPTVHLFFD